MSGEQLIFAEVPIVRDGTGRFRKKPTEIPKSAEVATVTRGELLGDFVISPEYPNSSEIIREKASGRGIRLYDHMLKTDGDLKSFETDLSDDVVKSPLYVSAASEAPEHQEHKRFLDFQIERMSGFQASHRHLLKAYGYGFSVMEKTWEVVTRGEWAGAVVFRKLIDKPARWFTFDLQRRLRIRTSQSYSPGELVDPKKFIVTTWGTNDSPWGDPMLDYCYWPWRFRHHAFKGEAVWFDRWANPTGLVEYETSADPATNVINRAKAVDVMEAIQESRTVGVPKGLLVSLLESARNGSISWSGYRESIRQIMSRIWTGQILLGTGDQGGSYAAMEVHQEQEGKRVQALGDFSAETWTDIFRESIDRNYGPQDVYPTVQIFTKPLSEQLLGLQVVQLKQVTGHKVSASWSNAQIQNVLPESPEDELVPRAAAATTVTPPALPPKMAMAERQKRVDALAVKAIDLATSEISTWREQVRALLRQGVAENLSFAQMSERIAKAYPDLDVANLEAHLREQIVLVHVFGRNT